MASRAASLKRSEQDYRNEYKPEYCAWVIDAARRGFSISGFCGSIGVHRGTLENWRRNHPDFRDSVAVAEMVRVWYLEARAANLMDGHGSGGSVAMVIFALKNADPQHYRDRHELTGPDGKEFDTDPGKLAAALLELYRSSRAASDNEPKTVDAEERPPIKLRGAERRRVEFAKSNGKLQ
jgi:hypothetical protein